MRGGSRSRTASSSHACYLPPLLTKPPNNNPPSDDAAPVPGKAIRTARMLIALGLFVGVGIFAVFTIEELKQGPDTTPPPNDFGASNQAPAAPVGNDPLAGLTGTDPTKFIPILRPNPHPGEISPFQKADPFGQAPYRQPSTGGEIWEFCAYRVSDATPKQAIKHYDQEARLRGMRLIHQAPTSNNKPGGVYAAWSDGRNSLNVTAWPTPNAPPPLPPLKPTTPLDWVVKYSYPEPTRIP